MGEELPAPTHTQSAVMFLYGNVMEETLGDAPEVLVVAGGH